MSAPLGETNVQLVFFDTTAECTDVGSQVTVHMIDPVFIFVDLYSLMTVWTDEGVSPCDA